MNTTIKLAVCTLLVAIVGESPSSAQTPRLNKVMREKLTHSQAILEAVVTSNWELLARHSSELARASEDPAWMAFTMPEYVRQTGAFLRATDDLIEAAKLRNLEAASLGLVSLTTNCVTCHRYMARARLATTRP